MIDIKNYYDKRVKGLISIQRIDDNNFAIATKRFNPEDGSELPATVEGITVTEVDEQIAVLQSQIDELNSFKKDLQPAVVPEVTL